MDADELLSFLHTARFDREWEALHFDDEDLADLQSFLRANPERGDVLRNGGGLRKLRYSRRGEGKSGGVRVCYANLPRGGIVLLACVFAKNQQANLNAADLKGLSQLIARLEHLFRGD